MNGDAIRVSGAVELIFDERNPSQNDLFCRIGSVRKTHFLETQRESSEREKHTVRQSKERDGWGDGVVRYRDG